MLIKQIAQIFIVLISLFAQAFADELTPSEARKISKEAYIYANPMVDGYRIQYAYFVDSKNREFKAPWNSIKNIARVYTPEDTAVQTPNSDTPYSMAGLDLRQEPIILTVPKIEKDRYFSIQLVDLYTYNFDYIGSRTTGNNGGKYMIVGPKWSGKTPQGIDKVFKSETELIVAIYRTQLFNPSDIENVKKIQSEYKIQTLSSYVGKKEIKSDKIDFIKPLTSKEIKSSTDVFSQLNFILKFCPTVSSEKELMARFAKINIGAGKDFNISNFTPEIKQAIEDGIADAWLEFDRFQKTEIDTGIVTSGDLFGTREYLKNNYLYRMAASVVGIYGNSKQEAMYPVYFVDNKGNKLNGAKRYKLYFAPNNLPPVNAFWSLTMYELPSSLLVKNPINRYLLNSSMVSQFKKDSSGGITFYIQNSLPSLENETNWLPAPKCDFVLVMRLYWPKEPALDGKWRAPAIEEY